MIKRVLILSTIILIGLISLISIDILNIQLEYTNIEIASNSVSNEISKYGGISNSVRQYVKKEIKGDIYCVLDDCTHIKSGDTYIYIIEKEIKPIIISFNTIKLNVKKSIIIM